MTQPPPDQPNFEKRLTDALVNLVVAGSGGYALYNLYVDEVPKAAIAGLVALGSGLMTSFGQGLMSALTDRMKQRGEASGKFVDRAIDATVDKTLAQLTGFHRQYLEALKTHCHSLNVEGYKGRLPRLVLEDLYVPLRVNSERSGRSPSQSHSQRIWELLPKAHHPDKTFPERLLAIIADPGYGKTTLLRFLTLTFASRAFPPEARDAKELIPILLLLRECYKEIQSKTQPPLPQLIVKQVQQLPRCSELRSSEPWFREQLNQEKCLVMLDGLDEVPETQRELVSQWINWQMQNYPTQFIVTSRPHGYDSSLFEGVQRVDILDFNNDQKQAFINQWYRFITWEFTWRRHLEDSQRHPDPNKHLSEEQVRAESDAQAQRAADDLSRQLFAEPSLTNLAKNPLLITIIAATHEANESLPTQRVKLYKEIFKLLLEDRPYRRDTRLTISNAEDNQKILQQLATKLTEAEITQFSSQQGAGWIAQRLAEVYTGEELTPRKFLREVQQVSGLLAGGESNLYEFTHKTFQEYLTAVELSESEEGKQQVTAQFANENWKEVVYFYAILTNPTPFIEIALQNRTNGYTLSLANRLVNESSRVPESLKQALLTQLQQQEPESAEVRLAQRFRQLTPLTEITAISDEITWGEYQLFLCEQVDQQFHSWAEELRIIPEQQNQPVTRIRWQDACWFCAWLSTQSNLAPDEGVYTYRLPTLEEAETVGAKLDVSGQCYTTEQSQAGSTLRVVRQQLPDRYSNLLGYLANGRWKEADQETEVLMLKAVGKAAEERGYLQLDEIRSFPCDDLRVLDQLWVKFSGGKFGFSVQKQIWVEVGGKLDFGEDSNSEIGAYQKMCDRNEWRLWGKYISRDKVRFDTSAPLGHLPSGGETRVRLVRGLSVLFWRTQTCEL